MAHPDQKYIEAIVNNDSPLIEEIYFEFLGDIEKMVKRLNGSEQEAKDIFQEALIDLFFLGKKGFTLNNDCSFRHFLGVICHNKWVNELNKPGRKNKRTLDTETYPLTEEPFKAAEEILMMQRRVNLVKKLFHQLTESKRKLLELRWDGNKNKEIARMLDMSEEAVRVGIHDGLKKLTEMARKYSFFNF